LNGKVYIALVSLLFFFQLKAQQDVGVQAMVGPLSGCNIGTSSTNMNVIVRNYSASFAFPNSITVRYRINGGAITSELIGALIGPNASFNFTFFQTANLSACGTYQFKIWTQKIGDPNPLNDTLNYTFVNDCNPIPGTITGPLLLCDNINNDSLVVSGGTFSYGYQWFQQTVPGPFNPTGNSTNKFYLNNLGDSTTYYIRYNGGLCPNLNSPNYGIGISPNIVTGTVSPDLVMCVTNVVGNVSNSGFTAIIEDWEQSNNGGVTWNSLGTTSSSVNINYLTSSALFRSKIKSGACGSKYSDTVSVTVEQSVVPGIITGATNVCSGFNSVNLTLSGTLNQSSYEWYTSTDNITFTPTGFTTSVYLASNITATTYYKVVAYGNTCSDAETPVVSISVDPPVNPGTVSPNLFMCVNNVVGAVSISGYSSTLIEWQQSNDNGATWFSTGVSTNSHDISYLTATARFRAAIQSGVCPIGYSNEVIVTLDPLIVPGTILGADHVCGVSNLDSLELVGYSNAGFLQWYYTFDSITYNSANVTYYILTTSNLTQTAHFFVVLSSPNCPSDTSNTVTIQVDPYLNLGTPSPDLVLCENNVVGTVSISGFSSTIIDWEQSNDGGLSWFSTGDNSIFHDISGITANADFRAFIGSGLCGTGYSDTISVTIDPVIIPGSISSGSTVCSSGNTDTLFLTGNANDFGFQWFSSTDNIAFTPTGVTNDTLIATNLTQTTYYKVVLTGNGCPDDETNVATITVSNPLNLGITSSDLTLCSSNIVGAVSVSGFAATLLDWEQSNDGGLTWFSTADNSSSHDISGLSSSADFRALIDAGGCGLGYTDTISVVIENAIIPGSIAGASTVCSTSNSVTIVLSGNANETGFQWYSSIDNITFTPTGITNDTLITSGLTQTTYYKVVLFGNVCSNEETSVISIQVNTPLNLGTTSSDLILCSTSIIGNVTLSGFNSTLVDWEQSNNGGLTWFSTGVNTNSLDISYLTASADFRAIVDAGACGSGISDTVSVIIENAIVPGTINGNPIVCTGPNTDTLILTGNLNDYGYQWYFATLNTSFFPTGISNDTIIVSNLLQTTYYKVILLGNVCPNAETAVFTVQLNPSLNVGTTSADLNLCSSNITGSVSLSGFATTLLDWEQSNDGGLTWFSTGSSNNPMDISYLTASADFRALVESPGCGIGYSDTINVEIQPAIVPGSISGTTIVCSGANSDTLVLTGNLNDYGYQWYTATLNTSFFPTGVTNDTLILTNITQETYVKVILAGSNCPADETPIFTIQVNPPFLLGTTSPDLALCSSNINGSVSLSGYSTNLIDWEQSNDGGLTWFSTGINTDSLYISYLTASADFRAFIQAGGCGSGYSDTINVEIQPAIVPGSISGTSIVCSGANSDTLVLTGNLNDYGYQWYTATLNTSFFPTGVTNDTLILTNITQETYVKVILAGSNCPADETPIFTIQVNPPFLLGVTSPDLALCSSNINGSVSLSGYSTNLIDWEQSNDGGLTWFSTGSNTNPLDISYLTASADFRAFIQAGSCGSGYSDTINVDIQNAIIPGSISGATILCSSANSDTLVLIGNANDFGYQWYTATLNASFFPTGVTNDTLILTNITQETYVKVILTGSNCPDDETSILTIQIDPPLLLGTPSPDLELCSSNITGVVSLTGSSTIVDWQQSNDGGLTWFSTGSSSNPLDISFLSASASFYANVSSGTCGSGISDTIDVVIEDSIVPGLISGGTALCYGFNTDTLVLSGFSNQTGFQWYTATLNTSFIPIGITNDTLIATNLTQTTYYKVVLTGNICPNDETPVYTLQVDLPVVTGLPSPDLNLCADNISGTISLTNFNATILNWEISINGGTSWSTTGSNSNPLDISFIAGSALFRAVIGSGSCGTGISDTISVIVDQLGAPASIGFDFDACIGSPDLDSMKLFTHTGSIAYWQFSTNGGASWSPTLNSDSIYYANYLLQNTSYQLVTSHGACPNVPSNTVNATVNPLPIVSAGPDTQIIFGTATQLNGSGGLFGVWTPITYLSNPNLPSPNCYPIQTTNYAYTVIDANGCTNTDYVEISVIDDTTDLSFIIYNIVTPNGDGKNDYFTIKGLNTIGKYRVNIFNANGNLLFSSIDYNNDWGATYKGEVVPDGTYLYAIEIDNVTKYRGFLTIMKGND